MAAEAPLNDRINIGRSMLLIKSLVTPDEIMKTVTVLCRDYPQGLVVFGGQTATPQLLGFKNMRRLTNDIDFAVSGSTLAKLQLQSDLSYFPEYNVYYGYSNGILCVFNCGHIHDWTIPADFFSRAATVSTDAGSVRVCAPEYSVMLKMRRGKCNQLQMFGKDSLDIINILCASRFRSGLPLIDRNFLQHLIRKHIGQAAEVLFTQIKEKATHAGKEKAPVCREILNAMSEYVASTGKTQGGYL